MDSCESHDTGQGTFRPPTESFSFKHALLHLMILVKPAYEGYFNRIGSAPFPALSNGVQRGSRAVYGQMGKWVRTSSIWLSQECVHFSLKKFYYFYG